MNTQDNVNHPAHYNRNGIEVIDVIDAFTSDLTGIEATHTANAIKYICRWKHKNGYEDIEKAIWYLSRMIHKPDALKSAIEVLENTEVEPQDISGFNLAIKMLKELWNG